MWCLCSCVVSVATVVAVFGVLERVMGEPQLSSLPEPVQCSVEMDNAKFEQWIDEMKNMRVSHNTSFSCVTFVSYNVSANTCTCTNTCTCMSVCLCACVHVYIHTHIYIYIITVAPHYCAPRYYAYSDIRRSGLLKHT